MKKLLLLLCAALVFALLAGCGGAYISKEAFGIENENGQKLCLGDIASDKNLPDIAGVGIGFLLKGDLITNVSYSNRSFGYEKNKTLCGIQVGDDAEKIISVLGKNKIYDIVKDRKHYTINYLYYEDNGKLCGTSDKLGPSRPIGGYEDEAEEAFYQSIKDKVAISNGYQIIIAVTDGKVESVAFIYYPRS